jgi:uncharacterized coiled-coil protein SlyX
MKIHLFALFLFACLAVPGTHAQSAAIFEAQIAALSARMTAQQVTIQSLQTQITAANQARAAGDSSLQTQITNNTNSLQKQITLVQSSVTMQAANLAALTKSFTPVQSAVTATQGVDTAQSGCDLGYPSAAQSGGV